MEAAKLKGIPAHVFLKREMKRRGFSQRNLALIVNEHPQTLNSILKGR
ncbi:hypothetical protein SAMN05443429_106162 [Cruoricaptor ignavus]|uniref:Helix-turn-helix n=1 Tax=Cruoricaptor ignavus TaxID=1118202 RepID=A0A1M6FAK5_9FLAO|nr:hypothetical protein SAMN05443429_106162 [Cruoricaptor ignavus]